MIGDGRGVVRAGIEAAFSGRLRKAEGGVSDCFPRHGGRDGRLNTGCDGWVGKGREADAELGAWTVSR